MLVLLAILHLQTCAIPETAAPTPVEARTEDVRQSFDQDGHDGHR